MVITLFAQGPLSFQHFAPKGRHAVAGGGIGRFQGHVDITLVIQEYRHFR